MLHLPHRPAWVMLAVGLPLAAGSLWGQAPAWQAGIAQVSAKDKSPGTGVVVSLRAGRAYLVTLAHVVAGDPSPSVVFVADPDKNPYRAQVLDVQEAEGGDRRKLALLVVQNPPAGVRAIEPAADPAVARGTAVVVAGFPSAIGRFSVLPAHVVTVKGLDMYLSPVTLEGYSGGPVLLEGRIAGMVFGRLEDYGGAVPAAIVGQYLRGHEVAWGTETAKRAAEPSPAPAKPAEPAPGTVRVNPSDGQPYVWIPPGEFQMGCSPGDQECDVEEKPPRKVRLTRGFWLGQTEVTVGAYKRYAAKMGVPLPEQPVFLGPRLNPDWSDLEQPMVKITWQQAKSYCESWAKGRLPTEAEWEYAARAGSTAARYGELDAIAWYVDNSGLGARRVKQRQPNAWGLYDMLGNVWEWTADQYGVVRGGSWLSNPRYLRVSDRDWDETGGRDTGTGVRCAWE